MPVIARERSAAEVACMLAPGTHAVGGVTGLCLQVTDSGARSWLLRIKVDSRRREFGLGSYPTVTLSSARNKARKLREDMGGGLDLTVQRRAARGVGIAAKSSTISFKTCAEAHLAGSVAEGRDARYIAQALRDLERLAFPRIGSLKVHSIDATHMLAVLEPIWVSKHATATKLRGHIERVLDFATSRGYREGANPARWTENLSILLVSPKTARRGRHHPVLPVEDMPQFIAQLRRMPGVAARALEFAILTNARPSSVRAMTWDEIDAQAANWTNPGAREDGAGPCSARLSERAASLIATRPRGLAQHHVFSTARSGGMLSDMAMTAVIRRMNDIRVGANLHAWVDPTQADREVVPNGLRATFRTWAVQKRYSSLLTDQALAMRSGRNATDSESTERHDIQRHAMMMAWERFCDSAKTT